MANVVNLFTEKDEALRYDKYRPVYHHLLCQRLREFFGRPIGSALDVACGTGHSTRALAAICERVVGIDLSLGMLEVARSRAPLEFLQAPAERIPFGDAFFDYLNLSMAFHWLDQERFLIEAFRVLKPSGVLGIDNQGFSGVMAGDPDFKEKFKTFDDDLLPSAARHPDYPAEVAMNATGFLEICELRYGHEVPMDSQAFVGYLMTRSNFLNLSLEKRALAEKELFRFYDPIFAGGKRAMIFSGLTKLYRKSAS